MSDMISEVIDQIGTEKYNQIAFSDEYHEMVKANESSLAVLAATAGIPMRALYSASKGAVLSLTQAMANDHLDIMHCLQSHILFVFSRLPIFYLIFFIKMVLDI